MNVGARHPQPNMGADKFGIANLLVQVVPRIIWLKHRPGWRHSCHRDVRVMFVWEFTGSG